MHEVEGKTLNTQDKKMITEYWEHDRTGTWSRPYDEITIGDMKELTNEEVSILIEYIQKSSHCPHCVGKT